MSDTRVLALVGSLRSASINRRIAEAIRDQAPAGVSVDIAEGLGELPFYNEDIDGDATPAPVRTLREQVAAADSVLVVTPEYNGSTPAVIANAIDWISRPYGSGAIKGKPVAVVGTAVGRYGGTWAHNETRKSAKIAGAEVLEHVEVSHPYAWGSDPSTEPETVGKFIDAVAQLVAHVPVGVG